MRLNIKIKQPSANSLVVFEVVSRHLSFTRACEELRTTRVAISSQIKLLETQIGKPLFLREHRGLRLTPAGEVLAEVVSPSFQTITQVLDRLSSVSSDDQLSISVSHGMSSHWLMPRIHRFRKQYPDVDFRFQVTDSYVDLTAEGVDVALRYGDGPWQGVASKRLIQVERFPVCSPLYLRDAERLETPQDLTNHNLLHLSGNYGNSTRWKTWLHEVGLDSVDANPGLTLDDQSSLIEAALAGEGIALAGPPQISDYLRRGLLVRVLQPYATSQRYFWSARPKDQPNKPIALAFETWLSQEMDQSF